MSLTVDAHLPVAVFLQEELDVRAGRGDVLGTDSDSCAQPVSLVKEEGQTAHRRPRRKIKQSIQIMSEIELHSGRRLFLKRGSDRNRNKYPQSILSCTEDEDPFSYVKSTFRTCSVIPSGHGRAHRSNFRRKEAYCDERLSLGEFP